MSKYVIVIVFFVSQFSTAVFIDTSTRNPEPTRVQVNHSNEEVSKVYECLLPKSPTTYDGCNVALEDLCNKLRTTGCNFTVSCSCPHQTHALPTVQRVLCHVHSQLKNVSNHSHECFNSRIQPYKCSMKVPRVKAGFNVVFGVCGIIGNIIVIMVSHVYYKNTRFHDLIKSLAIADFIFSAFQVSYHIPILWSCEWVYGLWMCKLFHSVLNLSYVIAIGFIVIIAIERYTCIVRQGKHWFTDYRIWRIIAINIVTGIVIITPIAVYQTVNIRQGGKATCDPSWPNQKSRLVYGWFLFTVCFLIPFIFLAVIYWKVNQYVKDVGWRVRNSMDRESQKKRVSVNKKLLNVSMAITILFFVLVIPNRLTWLIIDQIGAKNYAGKEYDKLHSVLYIFGFIPYSLHVAINPLIYSLIYVDFRQNLKKMLQLKVIVWCINLLARSNKQSRCENNEEEEQTLRVTEV